MLMLLSLHWQETNNALSLVATRGYRDQRTEPPSVVKEQKSGMSGMEMKEWERQSTDVGWRLNTVVLLDLLAWIVGLTIALSLLRNGPHQQRCAGRHSPRLNLAVRCWLCDRPLPRSLASIQLRRGRAVAVSAGGIGIALIALESQLHDGVNGGQLIVITTSLAVCFMFGHRYVRRMRARRIATKAAQHRIAVIVYGAGEGGERAIGAMQSVGNSAYRPVAVIDDNPAKRHYRIHGVRVVGTRRRP